MADAPDRIWAWDDGLAHDWVTVPGGDAIPYIRADLHEKTVAELVEALGKVLPSVKRDALLTPHPATEIINAALARAKEGK